MSTAPFAPASSPASRVPPAWPRAFRLTLFVLGALGGLLAAAQPGCADDPGAAAPVADAGGAPADAAGPIDTGLGSSGEVSADSAAPADSAAEASGPACTVPPVGTVVKVSVADLKALLDAGTRLTVLDVREPSETASGVIAGAVLLPWSSGVLKARHAELPIDRPLYVLCQSGTRSALATDFLSKNGHACVHDTGGGMMAWKAASYPTSPP